MNRRQFLKSGAATAAAATVPSTARAAGFRPPSQAGRGVKLSCSTAPWRQDGASFTQTLAAVAAAGYEWVDAQADDVWEYHESPEDLRKLLEKHSLGLVTVTLEANFTSREERLKNISRAVWLARALQALDTGLLVLESTGWGGIPREPRNYHAFSGNLAEVGGNRDPLLPFARLPRLPEARI